MTPRASTGPWGNLSIRARLAIVLAIALAPVLLLSAVQSVVIFRHEASDQRAAMIGAAERSAASVSARLSTAEVLLQSLAPLSDGPDCAPRLAAVRKRIASFANIIRFDTGGKVLCAAGPAPADARRRLRPWFRDLANGSAMTVTSDPGAIYAEDPALLASVRAEDEQARQVGVLTGVMTLASLRPATDDRLLPVGTRFALIDAGGRFLSGATSIPAPPGLAARLAKAQREVVTVWCGRDGRGAWRVFAVAPMAGETLWVLLSAPYRDVVAWAWVNPVTTIGLPALAFALTLLGVWIVADREIVRWIAYLQRIAAIYASGRYSVHPERAKKAPREIRDLAQTLDTMSEVIAARDTALRESLIHKDGLMREIHHRVKNNLQVISSLLNMQQRALTDPAARAAISDTRQRITALALIYRALYEGPDLRKVDLREFLEDLIGQLIMTDSGARPNLRTDLAIDSLSIDPDHLAPLALFAVEAITNAKKHGVASTGGLLSVTFRVCGAEAELCITDSGRPDSPPPVVGEGVGHTLMLAFARQLGGHVEFSAAPKGGMTARLTFPTPLVPAGA